MDTKIMESSRQECKEKIVEFFKYRRDYVNELPNETLYFRSKVMIPLDDETTQVMIKGTIEIKPTEDKRTEITVRIPDHHKSEIILRLLSICGFIALIVVGLVCLFSVHLVISLYGTNILLFGVFYSVMGGLSVDGIGSVICYAYWIILTRHAAGRIRFLEELLDFLTNQKF